MTDWLADPLAVPTAVEDDGTEGESGSNVVGLMTPDVHGSLRGKAYTASRFERVVQKSVPVPDFIFMVDPTSQVHRLQDERLTQAFGDIALRPELETLHPLRWRPGWSLCLGTPLWSDGEECDLGVRVVLRRVLDRLASLGLTVKAAFEYEVALRTADGTPAFSQVSYAYDGLATVQPLLQEFQQACQGLMIDLEVLHTEDGPGGVLEVNIQAKPGVEAADDAILLRTCLRDLARCHGFDASFLAKSEAGADGCGGHLHLSLWNEDDNAFVAEQTDQQALAPTMSASIAGLIAKLGAFAPFYLPTMNSYKRIVPDHSAPVNLTWGIDNRLAAVRAIIDAGPEATRLELRVPGADANPYLVLAAAIASMAIGIEQELQPPEPAHGAATLDHPSPKLPMTLESALREMEEDEAVADSVGDPFAQYFAETRRWELEAWQRNITGWERERGSHVV